MAYIRILGFTILFICVQQCLTFPTSIEAAKTAASSRVPPSNCVNEPGKICLQSEETEFSQTEEESDEAENDQCCEEESMEVKGLELSNKERQKKCLAKKEASQAPIVAKLNSRPTPKPCGTPNGQPCLKPTPKPASQTCGSPGGMPCEQSNARPVPKPTPTPCGKPNQKPCDKPAVKPTEKPTKKPAPNTAETTPTPIQVLNYNYITIQMKSKKTGEENKSINS